MRPCLLPSYSPSNIRHSVRAAPVADSITRRTGWFAFRRSPRGIARTRLEPIYKVFGAESPEGKQIFFHLAGG